ncbi:trypsin-7-like [Drosophila subpulchrella]|uniref:trypsin-7-like n=1 Tax=Drosophila subpulchrella TaxID=1486046 RepID=UPI0018A14A9C|nr:trypsin-7-like [Drosophila subpulchrella]XP_037731355.1 trypsin-7-like [Drosophila subpulchrella]XP_037731375.1 trypsin-7-like [Drosophila subpulchrella]
MLRLACVLFLAILPWSADAQNVNDNCGLSGNVTAIKDVPWIASVQHDNKHICIGTILNTKHILTASECLKSRKIPGLKVRVGNANRDSGLAMAVCKVLPHPNSVGQKGFGSNLALLTLCEPLTPSEEVKEIAIVDTEPDKDSKAEASVAGWGSLSWWRWIVKPCWTVSSAVLRKSNVQLMDVDKCASERKGWNWFSNPLATDLKVCTAKKEKYCSFDKGAPLVIDGKLAGILVLGDCDRKPDVFVSLFKHKTWLQANTKDT